MRVHPPIVHIHRQSARSETNSRARAGRENAVEVKTLRVFCAVLGPDTHKLFNTGIIQGRLDNLCQGEFEGSYGPVYRYANLPGKHRRRRSNRETRARNRRPAMCRRTL